MKKGEFSYLNGRALSHASLQRFRQQSFPNNQQKSQISGKQPFPSKPNVKYYSNTNQVTMNTLSVKSQYKKSEANIKAQQQLKKKVKTLQYELKKKINEHSYLVKLFKTKNTSELSHLDIYLQLRKLEEESEAKNQKIQALEHKVQESGKQVQDLLRAKQEQEEKHIHEIQQVMTKIEKLERKQKQDLQQKDRIAFEQRKTKQEKDILLKQVRKKYEQSQRLVQHLQNQILQLKEGKHEIQNVYKERIHKTKEDLILKIEESHNEIERYCMKVKQQEDIIKEVISKSNQKQSQKEVVIQRYQSEFNKQAQQLITKTHQIQQLERINKQQCEQISQLKAAIVNEKQCRSKIQEAHKKENSHFREQNQKLQRQKDQLQHNFSEIRQKLSKYEQEVSHLETKFNEANAKLKMANYQKEDAEVVSQKLLSCIKQKQKIIETQQSTIFEIENKYKNMESRCTIAQNKNNQLQKMIEANRFNQSSLSKLQIQNYKSMGRLMELSNQISALIGKNNSKDNFNSLNRQANSKNTKIKHKFDDEEQQLKLQPQTITQHIDNLTHQFQILIKHQYNNLLTQTKQNKQLLEQIVCDIKSIFHAYNSYIQDEALMGATREYLECLQVTEKGTKKQRNSYLQVILQRLISMIAIQSYASEKGVTRKNMMSKGKMSHRKHLDSLDDMDEEEDEENRFYENKRIIRGERVERGERDERGQSRKKIDENLQKYRTNKQSRKKLNTKLFTQPCQSQFHSRYGKQNIMNRLNKNEQQTGKNRKYFYASEQQSQQGYMSNKQYDYGEKMNAKLKTRKMQADQSIKQARNQKRHHISQAELIQKKYFR